MNLSDMRTLVRRDLHDEDSCDYRWTDDELDRHIAKALKDFSNALPLEQKAILATTAGSREVSIASLTNRVMIEAVEYPAGQNPARFQRFALWNDILTLLGEETPDGSNCAVHYGKLHTLDATGSTIPAQFEDMIVTGACGYAGAEMTAYCINRVNSGGSITPQVWGQWSKDRLDQFKAELRRLSFRNRVRNRQLYNSQDCC